MAKQSFIWTALPNGYTPDGKSIRVSVMLSPRLEPEADPPVLGSFFPDWEDWPETLKKARFEVSYGGAMVAIPGNQTSGANRVEVQPISSSSGKSVWKALFHDDLLVHGFHYNDLSKSKVLSYDTIILASLVRELYGKLARMASGNMPKVSEFVNNPDWRRIVDTVMGLDAKFSDANTGLRDPVSQFKAFPFRGGLSGSDENKIAETLARFQLYHTPPSKPLTDPSETSHKRTDDNRITAQWIEYNRPPMPNKEDLGKQLDFHQIISAMNSYPIMLRQIGIVVDLILDVTSFEFSSNERLSVEVVFPPDTLAIKSKNVSPQTHTLLSATKFQAVSSTELKPEDVRVIDGLLDVDLNHYDILQVDIDGAGLKLMNFARSLAGLINADVPEHAWIDAVTRFEKELGAPSLRNAGFMLVYRDRGTMLKNRFESNNNKNTAAETGTTLDLYAEDLVRGYRIDIWDSKTAVWRSICQREAKYFVDEDITVTPDSEEGTVRLAATKSADPDGASEFIYLHEAVVSWTGWSLTAPLPGRALASSIDPEKIVDRTTTHTEAELPPGLMFKTRFKAMPASLPRLRIGRRYWIRARVVDLAGNSLPFQDKDFGPENTEKNARLYSRFEPVVAPIIALVRTPDGVTEKPKEGESMERIAIRSFNNTPADNLHRTDQSARRFAVPPQSTVKDAEVHSKLDTGTNVDKSKFDMLANQKDRDARDVMRAALIEEKIKTNGPLDREEPVETTFAVYKDGESLTYLPDPIAEEVMVRIFDHPNISDRETIRIPLYPSGDWPNAQPFKIQVFEYSSKPSYDEGTHTLLVPLPKAIRAKVRLSMGLSKQWLDRMGIWNWLSPEDKAFLENMALDGQHWMLTPWRTVEVVHAVQRPLITPEISKIDIKQRAYAATSAMPTFITMCSLRSTDHLDLLAEWHEPKDDPIEVSSEKIQIDRKYDDVAFTIKINDPKSYLTRIIDDKLGGFAEHMIIGEDTISVNMMGHEWVAQKSHEFHDTRYRRIEYWLEGTTKFREYMPHHILTKVSDGGTEPKPTDENIKVSGPHAITWIRSSAPPPAPEVLYVLPTFGWARTNDDRGNQSSWRRGGGLRVYLARPWNMSGYGEMLGVILPPESFKANPDDEPKERPYKNYVTQWGNDPIWLSNFVHGISPKRTAFPLARTSPDGEGKWLPEGAPRAESDQPSPEEFKDAFKVTGLPLLGLTSSSSSSSSPTAIVEVAPHDVFYDKERRLWYCDIEIDQGSSYYPFIRLALARYQPVSEGGAHLSNIVLADFVPLTADRWLSVTREEESHHRAYHVVVYGSRYRDSGGHVEAKNASPQTQNLITDKRRTIIPANISATSVFEVWVETLDKEAHEDFGWERKAETHIRSRSKPKKVAGATPKLRQDRVIAGERLENVPFDTLIRDEIFDEALISKPLWDGVVTLPATFNEGVKYRLVIAEYEEYLIDSVTLGDVAPEKKGRRLIFVEHVEIT